MSIPVHLQSFKSSGIYRVVFDKSTIVSQDTNIMRLVVGYSEKGPFNTPVYIKSVSDFKAVYGDVSKKMEKRGIWFNKLAIQALSAGPILCLNLKKFDGETVGASNIDTEFNSDSPISNVSVKVEDIFDTTRFWVLSADKLGEIKDTNGKDLTGYIRIAAINTSNASATYFIRKASGSKVSGYNVTVSDWYKDSGEDVPEYLQDNLNCKMSDFMAEIYVFKGKFNEAQVLASETLSNYFEVDSNKNLKLKPYVKNVYGECTDTLDALYNDTTSGAIGHYVGSLIPLFKDKVGQYQSLDIKFNYDVESHNLMMYFDIDALEEGRANIDLSGHQFINETSKSDTTFDLTNIFGGTAKTTVLGNAQAPVVSETISFKDDFTEVEVSGFGDSSYSYISANKITGNYYISNINENSYAITLTDFKENKAYFGLQFADKNTLLDQLTKLGVNRIDGTDTTYYYGGVYAGDAISKSITGAQTTYAEAQTTYAEAQTAYDYIFNGPNSKKYSEAYAVLVKENEEGIAHDLNPEDRTPAYIQGMIDKPDTTEEDRQKLEQYKDSLIIVNNTQSLMQDGVYTADGASLTNATQALTNATQALTNAKTALDKIYETVKKPEAFVTSVYGFKKPVKNPKTIDFDTRITIVTNNVSVAAKATVTKEDNVYGASVSFIEMGDWTWKGDKDRLESDDSKSLYTYLAKGDCLVADNNTQDDDAEHLDNVYVQEVGQEVSNNGVVTYYVKLTGAPLIFKDKNNKKYFVRVDAACNQEIGSMVPQYLEGYTYKNPKPASTSMYDKLKWQNFILSVLTDYRGIRTALLEKSEIDYRYIIDTFESYVGPGCKNVLTALAKEKQSAFAILNFPAIKTFVKCPYASFTDAKGVFDTKYVVKGYNPSKSHSMGFSLPSESEGASFGAFYTCLKFSDGYLDSIVPSAALVSNLFMEKYLSRQPYYIVAGPNYGVISAAGLIGPDYNFCRAELDDLEPFGINAMVYRPGFGTFINSNQTAKQTPVSALSKVHIRELVIYLQDEIEKILQSYQWEFNNQTVRNKIKDKADSICLQIQKNGGIIDYLNVMDESNNTSDIIDNEMAVLSTHIEPGRGMGKMVHELTLYRTGMMRASINE